jgi:hypothetical protein
MFWLEHGDIPSICSRSLLVLAKESENIHPGNAELERKGVGKHSKKLKLLHYMPRRCLGGEEV